MSYCVNCGVELADSARKCPLCDTPVLNPNILANENAEPPFPSHIELPKGAKSRYTAVILSLVLLLPNIVCVITNLLLTPHQLWSVYVVASSAIFWFLFLFPFIMKKKRQYWTLAVDAVATAAYIFVFYYYDSPTKGWFWTLAVPLDVSIFLTIAALCAFFSEKRTLLHSLIAILAALTTLDIFVCLIVNLYRKSLWVTYVTLILGISCLILLIFFIVADKNYRLRAWLSRKFFF